MDKYSFNNIPVQNFSEPKPNYSFRDGKFWIKLFMDKDIFENEKKILEMISSCAGVVKAKEYGVVSIIPENNEAKSFDAIKEFYIKGKDLRTFCKKHYEETELIDVFTKLAKCLSEIELLGIIHNDIKPQNILITGDGEPILIDFGTSKFIDEKPLPIHMRFTDGFCAPEKRGNGIISIKSDIYSFGCVLCACMCQHPQGKSAFSKALIYVKNKCCSEDPESRYNSFNEIVNDLSNIEDRKHEDTTNLLIDERNSIFARLKKSLRQYYAVVLSISLSGAGLFFLFLAVYMIARGPSKPKGCIPNPKEDIQFVINDIKNKNK